MTFSGNKNQTIYGFLQKKDISESEFNILFEIPKSESDIDFFNKTLKKIIQLQRKHSGYDLSHICFPYFKYNDFLFQEKSIDFSYTTFLGKVDFSNVSLQDITFWYAKFKKETLFYNTKFNGEVQFEDSTFTKGVMFNHSKFMRGVNFNRSSFKGDVTFTESRFILEASFENLVFEKSVDFTQCIFTDNISFKNTNVKKLLEFSGSKFYKLDTTGLQFEKANFLNLKGVDKHNFEKENAISFQCFQNKESARVIKACLEKENNIIDSNKYFSIEQELYANELKKSKAPYRLQNLFVLNLHKYVSYFGTDWIRPIFVTMIFTFLFSLFYSFFQNGKEGVNFINSQTWLLGGFIYSIALYIFYHKRWWTPLGISLISYFMTIHYFEHYTLINDIAKLVNPLNIFKDDKNYFDDLVLYGMLIKLTVSTFFYQFIVSFRQNTRRKL